MSLENKQEVESLDTITEYADINETPDNNMENLLKNSIDTTKKIEQSNKITSKEYEKCLIECKDISEHNENYTTWLVKIFDSYLKQEA